MKTNKKTLLLFVPTTGCGGTERYVSIILAKLSQGFGKVYVIASHSGDANYLHEYQSKVDSVVFAGKAFWSPRRLLKVIRFVYLFKPDVVCDFRGIYGAIDLLICRLNGVPKRVAFLRNSSSPHERKGPFGRITSKLLRIITGVVSTRVLGNSRAAIVSRFPNLETEVVARNVIYNCVSEKFRGRPRKKQAKAACLKLIHVGSFYRQKNQVLVVQAIARLKHELTVTCTFLGDGPLLTDCKALADRLGVGDLCSFRGEITEVEAELAGSDYFVFPSFYEGMPNALLEALAFGVLPVAAAIPEHLEILPPELAKYTFDPNDVNSLVDALVCASLIEEFSYLALSDRCVTWVADHFDKDQSVKKLLQSLR